MSGSLEDWGKLGHRLGLVELHAQRVIDGILQGKSAAFRRLVNLEQAFHLYESSFHIFASTSYGYFRLEESLEVLLNGELVFPLTLQRKAKHRELPSSRDDDSNEWVFEDEPGLDLSASPDVLPRVVQDFFDEIDQVEEFAGRVQQGLLAREAVALLRLKHLEQAFYLYRGWEERLRSPSFRFGFYLRLLRRLCRGIYRFDLEAYLRVNPYPTNAWWRR